MRQTDEIMGSLASQVGDLENEIFSENQNQIEVNNLLQSVNRVKDNYQNLRKDLMEVQDLQKQLSHSLHVQLQVMQAKFNTLKQKLPPSHMARNGQNANQENYSDQK